MLAPAFNHLLRFHLVCCAEKVSDLINHPERLLFGLGELRGVSDKRVSAVRTELYLVVVFVHDQCKNIKTVYLIQGVNPMTTEDLLGLRIRGCCLSV